MNFAQGFPNGIDPESMPSLHRPLCHHAHDLQHIHTYAYTITIIFVFIIIHRSRVQKEKEKKSNERKLLFFFGTDKHSHFLVTRKTQNSHTSPLLLIALHHHTHQFKNY